MVDAAPLIPDWPAPPPVRTALTTRRMPGRSRPPFDAMNLGARCGDTPDAVAANRGLLIDLLGLPAAPHWLHQVHGTGVFAADGQAARIEPEADAAVTRTRGAVLAILTADCLPVLLCSDDGRAIGAVHAGWRGLAAGVIEATLARLCVSADHLMAWLGPAIGPASYEVGNDVRAAFVGRDIHAAEAFAATRPGHWRCDLYALARRRLTAAGITRVYGGALDTCTDTRFYSYRRDRETGRFASLIWLA
jgi:YfiH family protein